MRRKTTGPAHPGSPRFVRKCQKNVLDALVRRPHNLEQLGRALFGSAADPSQVRKLIATLATLISRRLVARSNNGTFKLTGHGQQTAAEGVDGGHDGSSGPASREAPSSGQRAILRSSNAAQKQDAPALHPRYLARDSRPRRRSTR